MDGKSSTLRSSNENVSLFYHDLGPLEEVGKGNVGFASEVRSTAENKLYEPEISTNFRRAILIHSRGGSFNKSVELCLAIKTFIFSS